MGIRKLVAPSSLLAHHWHYHLTTIEVRTKSSFGKEIINLQTFSVKVRDTWISQFTFRASVLWYQFISILVKGRHFAKYSFINFRWSSDFSNKFFGILVPKLSWEIWAVLPTAHSPLSHIIYSHLPHRGGPLAHYQNHPHHCCVTCHHQCIGFCLRTWCKAAEKCCTKIAMSRPVIEASKQPLKPRVKVHSIQRLLISIFSILLIYSLILFSLYGRSFLSWKPPQCTLFH